MATRLEIAIGEQMRRSAVTMEKKAGVPTGSSIVFAGSLPMTTSSCSSVKLAAPVPMKYRRQRGQLVDAMLDAHFT